MIWVQRDQTQEVTVTKCHRADPLADPHGEVAQPGQGRHNLFQLIHLEAKEDILERWAVQVQTNAVTRGHQHASPDSVYA